MIESLRASVGGQGGAEATLRCAFESVKGWDVCPTAEQADGPGGSLYTHMHKCGYMYTYTHMQVCVCVHTHADTYACGDMCMCACTCAHVYMYAGECTHMNTCV